MLKYQDSANLGIDVELAEHIHGIYADEVWDQLCALR